MIFFMVWFDPNVYKQNLSCLLEKTWHRHVYFEGPFKWTFYPLGGLQINQTSVGYSQNSLLPHADDKSRFLIVPRAEVGVALWPLLKKEIIINHLLLKNPVLNLIKNIHSDSAPSEKLLPSKLTEFTAQAEQTQEATRHKRLASAVMLSRFSIQEGQINETDTFGTKLWALNRVNVFAQQVALEKPFLIKIESVLDTDKLKKPVPFFLTANLTVSKDFKTYALRNIQAKAGTYQWEGFLTFDFSREHFAAITGQLQCVAHEGIFEGIDVFYYSDAADALMHKKQPTRPNMYQTPFKLFQSRFVFKDKKVFIQDFTIEINRMQLLGEGVFDRTMQTLDASLALQRLTEGADIKPRGPAIPLKVSGKLPKPTIRPDWNRFLMDQLSIQLAEKASSTLQEVSDTFQKKIQEGLQVFLNK